VKSIQLQNQAWLQLFLFDFKKPIITNANAIKNYFKIPDPLTSSVALVAVAAGFLVFFFIVPKSKTWI